MLACCVLVVVAVVVVVEQESSRLGVVLRVVLRVFRLPCVLGFLWVGSRVVSRSLRVWVFFVWFFVCFGFRVCFGVSVDGF